MRKGPRQSEFRSYRSRGFTLIELGVVIMIIGLLTSFVLVVSMEGVERAREAATQALIAKLEVAMNDRIAAIQSQQVRANLAHQWLAHPESLPIPATGLVPTSARADTIARIDFLKAELPDVFFVQVNPAALSTSSVVYPFNFVSLPFPGTTTVIGSPPLDNHVLPMGNAVAYGPALNPPQNQFGAFIPGLPTHIPTGTGIYGASYGAAAGLLKNLGTGAQEQTGVLPVPYLPTGYDGVDNNGNGFVDEFAEGVDGSNLNAVQASLANHTHATARSEMLYALLIESAGALLTRDNFGNNEVRDTDGDGLPEFVDGWGNPILFFRWPVFYHSAKQRGINPEGFDGMDNNGTGATDYNGTSGSDFSEAAVYNFSGEQRETNPLDPNNQLLSPVWWSNLAGDPRFPGVKAAFFQQRFFPLFEPLASSDPIDAPFGLRWDRNGFFKRRAFYYKFLILSAGADAIPGVPLLPEAVVATARTSTQNADTVASHLVLAEGRAAQTDLNLNTPLYPLGPAAFAALRPVPGANRAVTAELIAYGQDDLTNHNLRISGAGSQ
jgi:prepilin-type N-terminal cleavage/methylation domain-containing protein